MTINLVFAIISVGAAWLTRRAARIAEEYMRRAQRVVAAKHECSHRRLVQRQWLRADGLRLVESACPDCGLYDRGPLRVGSVH